MKLNKVTLLLLVMASFAFAGYDDPFYDYRGQNSFRESYAYEPEEQFDPFTGGLQLIYTDIYLPGNGGLDIKIVRVYNSNIYRDMATTWTPVPDSWVGLGWSLHMGRLVCPLTENKYLEMPDGSKHTFYQDINDPSQWKSKEYWRLKLNASQNYYEVTFTDGVTWRFSMLIVGSIPEPGGGDIYYPTTQIKDPSSNQITVEYDTLHGPPIIKKITDSCNRIINFNYQTTGMMNLNYIEVNGKQYKYFYDSIGAGYSLLRKVQLPCDPSGYYSYKYDYSTTFPLNELKKVYNPWGGTITYTFASNTFNVGGQDYEFRVLSQRQENPGGSWTFSYASTSDLSDSTVITDPYSTKTSFTMFGYRWTPTAGNNWKIGLVTRKRISGNGVTSLWQYTYNPSPAISNDDYAGPTTWDNQVYVPRLTKKEVTIDSKTYTTNYSNFDDYSQPKTISETGDASRTIARTYWYNTSLNIIDRIASESITYNSTTFSTNYTYNTTNGLMTSKSVAGVVTDYTYHPNGNLKLITDDSDRWIENTAYQYAIPKTINKGGVYTIERSINWAGTIDWEKNGRNYTTNFLYDDRNRLTRITPPGASPTPDPTIIEYHNQGDYKKVSQGSSWTKYNYDDWGRVDYSENSVGIKVDYTYDKIGRKTYDSYPYTNTRLGDTLTYDGLDRLKRTTHPDNPDNTYSEYTYYQSKVTYRNERVKNTEFQYHAFGNPFGDKLLISVKDARNQTTTYSYNAASYLTQISAAGGYTRTYHYNSKYFLDNEASPERVQADYGYDPAGNLISRVDASSNQTTYTYDNITRLTNINYPDTDYDVTYAYDNADNATQISMPSDTINQTYDALNRMTKKTLNIDGYAYADSFAYDSRSNITKIRYPDDQYVEYTYDSENRVLTIPGYTSGSITYHPSGVTSSYTTTNNRTTTFQFNNRYWITRITVSGNIMDEGYSYDAIGNLTNLTDYLSSPNNQIFSYDDIDRLIAFNGPWGTGSYNYASPYAISRRYQEIIGSNTTTYYYNSTTHRLTNTTGVTPDQHTFTYYANGNLNTYQGYRIFTGLPGYTRINSTFQYGGENWRVYVTGTLNGQINFYVWDTYDGNGTRIKEKQYIQGYGGEQPTYYYVNAPTGEILYEKKHPYSTPSYVTYKYVYLNGKLLCRTDNGASKYYYHTDRLGSVKAATNESGSKVFSWVGYPFGKDYATTGSLYNDFRFAGNKLDVGRSGLYYFGARFYMPEIGRFLTPDPIVGARGLNLREPISMSFYNYCKDNPIKYVDPNGRDVYVVGAMRQYVRDAYRRSATFRDLYDGLRRNRDVIVWMGSEKTNPWDKKSYRGRTIFKGMQGNKRYIDCYVVSTEDRSSQGYLAGHELVHATEIAENREIITAEDLKKWQQDMVKGKKAKKMFDGGWCTTDAQVNLDRMYQEIINDIKGSDDIQIKNEEIDKPYIKE